MTQTILPSWSGTSKIPLPGVSACSTNGNAFAPRWNRKQPGSLTRIGRSTGRSMSFASSVAAPRSAVAHRRRFPLNQASVFDTPHPPSLKQAIAIPRVTSNGKRRADPTGRKPPRESRIKAIPQAMELR